MRALPRALALLLAVVPAMGVAGAAWSAADRFAGAPPGTRDVGTVDTGVLADEPAVYSAGGHRLGDGVATRSSEPRLFLVGVVFAAVAIGLAQAHRVGPAARFRPAAQDRSRSDLARAPPVVARA